MKVEFVSDCSHYQDLHGVVFQATVNGELISCKISQEALQDIDPANRLRPMDELFESNKNAIYQVAKRLIMSGRIENNSVQITSADMKSA